MSSDFLKNIRARFFHTKFRLITISILCLITIFYLIVFFIDKITAPEFSISLYPYGKNFAFTITDDPDKSKLEVVRPIYDYLYSLGFKTTIALWIKNAIRSDGIPEKTGQFDYGDTCQNEEYFKYMKSLQRRGFEIALHTVTGGNDKRQETIEGYEQFKQYFGEYPKINIMHSHNLENIYWGKKVVSNKFMRWLIARFYKKANLPFVGEEETSPYYWGDWSKDKTKYIRLWGTSDINTLKFNPEMPYHDPEKPLVNYWFSYSDGNNVQFFNTLVSEKNIERLIEERGTAIIYTHFALGFCRKDQRGNYKLDKNFMRLMKNISSRSDGWFVPASTILDRLLLVKKIYTAEKNNHLLVVNTSPSEIKGLTILYKPFKVLYHSNGKEIKANNEGEIILERLRPYETLTLFKEKEIIMQDNSKPSFWKELNMIFKRALLVIKNRRFDYKLPEGGSL